MCPNCEARRKLVRDALLHAKINEAVVQAVKGAAEIAGLKKKTGAADVRVKTRRKREKPITESE